MRATPDPPPSVAALLGAPLSFEALRHNSLNSVTAGIWCARGPLGCAVVKVLSGQGEGAAHWPASDEPGSWNYWLREPMAYRSGFAESAYDGSGLAVPTLLAAGDLADGSVALWLEEVAGLPGPEWTVDRVAACARQLGRAQGDWTHRHRPDEPWLSRGFLRDYTASKPVALDPATWHHPVVRAVWPDPLPARLAQWARRSGELVALVETLPRTLCHLDVWPANLVGRGDESVLLDWSFVGDGAVGEDAGNLIPDCVFDGFFPASALPELAASVETSYLEGLAEAGWTDHETARIGVRAAGAAKYSWLAPAMLRRVAAGDTSVAPYGSGDQSIPVTDLLAQRRPALELLVGWAEAALTRPRP